MNSPRIKRLTSIKTVNRDTIVYDIKVKNNENFFANNVLVHNCYMRRNKQQGMDIVKNTEDIIDSIDCHVNSLPWGKTPDQTHDIYWTYDIGCNTDVALHYKNNDYQSLFDYFINSEKAFGSFATKRVNKNLLKINPNKKLRIRFSLMPEKFRQILEPKTSTIIERIEAINYFYDAGWDVHINFSPVIAYKNSSVLYERLFSLINKNISNSIKKDIKAEVIFLTHSEKMHKYNLSKDLLLSENILWQPQYQEIKTSQYGGSVYRYEKNLKSQMISKFKEIHNQIIPWNEIRYIF